MSTKGHDSEDLPPSRASSPDSYYREDDTPTPREKSSMWSAVARRLPGATPAGAHSGRESGEPTARRESSLHWRSFWLGQAAAVLLLLAAFGGYTLWNDLGGAPPESSLQQTYRSSLQELASSTQFLSPPAGEAQQEALESQLRGLEEIDRMIEEMRSDMLLNGSTQAKRQQLRRLYATKLDFVQKLILTEDQEASS